MPSPLTPPSPATQVPTPPSTRPDHMAWDCRWITDNLRLALPESSLALQHSPAVTSSLPCASASRPDAQSANSGVTPPQQATLGKSSAHAQASRFHAWACRSSRAQRKLRNLAVAKQKSAPAPPATSSRGSCFLTREWNKCRGTPSLSQVTEKISSISLTSPLFTPPATSTAPSRRSSNSLATAPPAYTAANPDLMNEDGRGVIMEEADDSSDSSLREMKTVQVFPHPALSLPTPQLEFDLRLSVTFSPQPTTVSLNGCSKDLYAAVSGTWAAAFAHGTISAGGHDMQIPKGHPTSPTECPRTRSKLDTVFTLQTADDPPATINLRTRGYLACNAGVLSSFFITPYSGGGHCPDAHVPFTENSNQMSQLPERVAEDSELAHSLDPRKYSCRMVLTLTTQDRRYADDLNMALWIGSGMWRSTTELVIDAYRIS